MLRVLVHDDDEQAEAGFTVFWPAGFMPDEFTAFYREAIGQVTEHRPFERPLSRPLGFDKVTGEEVQLDIVKSFNQLDRFDFIRLEHVVVGSDGSERPVLVVWCNLAGTAHPAAIDTAGVLMQPRHLSGLQQRLGLLIARSSRERVQLSYVMSMLNALGEHLNPDASPMALYA